jgi:hypothetical protein
LIIYSVDLKLQTVTLFLFSPNKKPFPFTMASFKNVRLSPAITITNEPVRRQYQNEPSPFAVQLMADIEHSNMSISLSIGLKLTMVQAMQIWIFQLAFIISIEWRILAVNSSDEEEDVEDHYDSDNGLTPEEREYRRQRDEQDAAHNADRTPARRAEIRENNRRRHQQRRAARAADDILPIYERRDNTIPDYDDETASRRSTPIPLTGNETWGDLNDATIITRLTVQQRADALALALVDSY